MTIYYHPEDYDLEVVATLDDEECYQFDMHVIFKDKQGRFLYGHDSGCSCPVPFEDVSLKDLEVIDKDGFSNFSTFIKALNKYPMTDKVNFLNQVKEAMHL